MTALWIKWIKNKFDLNFDRTLTRTFWTNLRTLICPSWPIRRWRRAASRRRRSTNSSRRPSTGCRSWANVSTPPPPRTWAVWTNCVTGMTSRPACRSWTRRTPICSNWAPASNRPSKLNRATIARPSHRHRESFQIKNCWANSVRMGWSDTPFDSSWKVLSKVFSVQLDQVERLTAN